MDFSPRSIIVWFSVLLPLSLGLASAAQAEPRVIFINEVVAQGAEVIELYNSQLAPKNLSGWRIKEGAEEKVLPGGTVIPGHGYVALSLDGILGDIGGELILIDLLGERQDAVSYGQLGSAPLPPGSSLSATTTLCRAPDASTFSIVPPDDPDTDGLYWTLDPTGTIGGTNDAPAQLLGSNIEINEIRSNPGGGDQVELYNHTNNTLLVNGWSLCNGVGFESISGAVPAHGFLVITTGATFDVDAVELLYLFDAGGVRRDQLGWTGGPLDPLAPESVQLCFGRFHDGDGPNLGYSWASSGGGSDLLVMGCTPGGPNGGTSDVESPEPVWVTTWGRLKARYPTSR
ncbi:MAG: lamin tail domain-containing protein [Candidatus Eisenbacteria bacterium]|nr:lamin tail domain-containing protein [Candidatus Eisenbacteria bacterium]